MTAPNTPAVRLVTSSTPNPGDVVGALRAQSQAAGVAATNALLASSQVVTSRLHVEAVVSNKRVEWLVARPL